MVKLVPNIIQLTLAAAVFATGLGAAVEAGERNIQVQRMTTQKPQGMKVLKRQVRTSGKVLLKQRRSNSASTNFGARHGAPTGDDFDYAIRSVGHSHCTYQGQDPSTVRFKVRNYGSEKPAQNVGVFVQFYKADLTPGTAVVSSVSPLNPGQETTVQFQIPDGTVQHYADGIHWKFQMVVNVNNGAGGGVPTLPEANLANNVVQGACWIAVP